MNAAAERPNLLPSLQLLRGIAALSVVFHHSIRGYTVHVPAALASVPAPALGIPAFYGALASGVDVFFVVSGIVMVIVADPYVAGMKPIGDFIEKRVIRIYPPYLFVTLVMIGGMLAHAALGEHPYDLTPARVLGAVTLIPTHNQVGDIQPILGVGWTLSYEMYFYILFALSVRVFRRHYVYALPAFLAALTAASGLLLPPDSVAAGFLGNPIVAEFAFGCLIGIGFKSGRLPRLGIETVAIAVLAIFAGTYFGADMPSWPLYRPLVWGIPAALAVTAFLRMDSAGRLPHWPRLLAIGDASYSIYLVHVVILYQALLPAAAHLPVPAIPFALDALILVSATICVLCGAAFYAAVERPLRLAAAGARRWAASRMLRERGAVP